MKKTIGPLSALAILIIILSGCAPSTTTPTISPVQYSVYELEYRLDADFGGVFWCDPHFWPIVREDAERAEAMAQFPSIKANEAEFAAILKHLPLTIKEQYTDEEKLLVFRQHKLLTMAMEVTPSGSLYQFTLRIGEGQGERIEGTISPTGEIKISKREPSINTCPICLAKGTLIATPGGPIPVEKITVGMIVWTIDKTGRRIPANVITTTMTPVPAGFQLVRTTLDDGRTVTASPGHPAADGKPLGEFHTGEPLDGGRIVAVEMVTYNGTATYDLLPAGGTGIYYADRIILKSTLKK
jgi:hypothetical protein